MSRSGYNYSIAEIDELEWETYNEWCAGLQKLEEFHNDTITEWPSNNDGSAAANDSNTASSALTNVVGYAQVSTEESDTEESSPLNIPLDEKLNVSFDETVDIKEIHAKNTFLPVHQGNNNRFSLNAINSSLVSSLCSSPTSSIANLQDLNSDSLYDLELPPLLDDIDQLSEFCDQPPSFCSCTQLGSVKSDAGVLFRFDDPISVRRTLSESIILDPHIPSPKKGNPFLNIFRRNKGKNRSDDINKNRFPVRLRSTSTPSAPSQPSTTTASSATTTSSSGESTPAAKENGNGYCQSDTRSLSSYSTIATTVAEPKSTTRDRGNIDPITGKQKVRRKASERARSILMDWLNVNEAHPYPTRAQKADLAHRTGMTVSQVVHWMSNVRKRRILPLMSGKKAPTSNVDRKFLAEMEMRKQQNHLLYRAITDSSSSIKANCTVSQCSSGMNSQPKGAPITFPKKI